MDKTFNKNDLKDLRELHYDGRRPSSLDAVKEELLKHIKTESVSKLSELQHYLKSKHSIQIEHSWLSRYFKKNSIALIKNKIDTGKDTGNSGSKRFISMMEELYSCASNDVEQVMLFFRSYAPDS